MSMLFKHNWNSRYWVWNQNDFPHLKISEKIQNTFRLMSIYFTHSECREMCVLEHTHNLVSLPFFSLTKKPALTLFLPQCKIKCYSTRNMPYRCHYLFSLGRSSPRQDCDGEDWHWQPQTYFRQFSPPLQRTYFILFFASLRNSISLWNSLTPAN